MATATAAALPDDIQASRRRGRSRSPLGRGAARARRHDFHDVTEMVLRGQRGEAHQDAEAGSCSALALAGAVLAMFGGYIGYLFWEGPGVWGNNNPVGWAWDIINFVFWVGIGHAGTLISRHPLPVPSEVAHGHQPFAEAMTIFAVICAPASSRRIHIGRIWMDYCLFPHPQPDGHVAELPQPAAVGRVRRQHLLHRLAAVLVHRPDP